ncbi:cysteine proteinase [Sordaria brevicollis]|uniref:ubiquitinyl hydrolase 1 n=1 Tax=Sordaria brevicollis TaxID=83679 RepID=A0AAE0PIQ6_SORBR|nr:cysteine proteinase [Sordaria brevicollis]
MCKLCRHHFVVRYNVPENACGQQHTAGAHHYIARATNDRPASPEDSKWYPRATPTVAHVCSLCGQTISVDVLRPHLKSAWINRIMDKDRIRSALAAAKREEPERYGDLTPEKEQNYANSPLQTLNMYLKNILEDDWKAPPKRIAGRNRTFSVQFGPACADIFIYLGFAEEADIATGDKFWVPPRLPIVTFRTPLGSERAFLENVRSEVQSFLAENPPRPDMPVVGATIDARDWLDKALVSDWLRRHECSSARNPDEAQHFRILGAHERSDEEALKYAYCQQVAVDPANQHIYKSALANLAGFRSEEFQMYIFSLDESPVAPSGPQTQGPLSDADKAYRHFNIEPRTNADSRYFINVYKTYRAQSPGQLAAHRLALLEIGKDRNDPVILDEVFDGEMDPSEACTILDSQPDWSLEIAAAGAREAVKNGVDTRLLIKACETLAESKRKDNVVDEGWAEFDMLLAELRGSEFPLPPYAGKAPQAKAEDTTEFMSLPVGLDNLRNTCYLNSILQYFYSVTAVRNFVLTANQTPLEPTQEAMQALLDGLDPSELDPGRAYVGSEFCRELGSLFRDIQSAGTRSVRPRQRLANAALLRPDRIRSEPVESNEPKPTSVEAPPLPPRSGADGLPKVTVDAVPEHSEETDSNLSSQTLVNQTEEDPTFIVVDHKAGKGDNVADDITMTDEPAPSTPVAGSATNGTDRPRNLKLTVVELNEELDKPNVGSDQMDVDEVMGNAIDHLRAAFKVESLRNPGTTGPDPIKEAFFSTLVDNRKKISEKTWNSSTRSERWVIAYPGKNERITLYDALSRSFDLETVGEELLTYTTIKDPAPNFHICISRSDGRQKNANPVVIPEVLYLDRFMHTDQTDSPLFKARQRSWNIGNRLQELMSRDTKTKDNEPAVAIPFVARENETNSDSLVDSFIHVDAEDMDGVEGFDLTAVLDPELDKIVDKYSSLPKPEMLSSETSQAESTPEAPKSSQDEPDLGPAEVRAFVSSIEAEADWEKQKLQAEREKLFDGMQQYVYRLHAVVCHAGTTAAAGHYWVWIYDFEENVWRKYNDTTVSVHPAEEVFEQLNTRGEPYYVAYVRAENVKDLVSIPRRQFVGPPVTGSDEQQATTVHAETVGDGDKMDLDGNYGDVNWVRKA